MLPLLSGIFTLFFLIFNHGSGHFTMEKASGVKKSLDPKDTGYVTRKHLFVGCTLEK